MIDAKQPITVSVIVPAYNASSTIGQTLEALTKQTFAKSYEIIVVDDGSRDNSAEIIAAFPTVKYVRQDNAGPASARNHGARIAKGEFLAFTDSDCIPHANWIELLLQGFVDSKVGVVAGSYGIANPESRLASCIHREIVWRHTHLMPDYPKCFGSYNFCVRKKVFEEVGGFRDSYKQASGEDNDISYKIIKAGWRIFFERKALVDHYHQTKVVKYLKEQFRHGFWRVAMYWDHPQMMRGDGYTYWKDILEMPLAFVLTLGLIVCVLHLGWFNLLIYLIITPFLFFECWFALMITHCFFGGIFYGFVLFFRALVRFFGLSTGILDFLVGQMQKIF